MAETKNSEIHLSKAQQELIETALAMEFQAAKDAGALGFMARSLVMATMPHSKVEGNEFIRKNGAFRLHIMSPDGVPYGVPPRLLMLWLTTEAVRKKSPVLELGDNLTEFMDRIGMEMTGGVRGGITRMKKQARSLFSSTVHAFYEDGSASGRRSFLISEEENLWWDAKDPNQRSLWTSTVKLTDKFFREITESPIPFDMRALPALRRSPLALDVYMWLTYRMTYLRKPTTIPWAALMLQFGSDYQKNNRGILDWKRKFLDRLQDVLAIYRDARVEVSEVGLTIYPSRMKIHG